MGINGSATEDSNKPGCWRIGDDKDKCYNKDDIDKAKGLMIVALITGVILFCLVGGLYHAVSKHEAKRIDIYLCILAVFWFISAQRIPTEVLA